MANIWDSAIEFDKRRELQRHANVEQYRREGVSRWRNAQQDKAGKDLYKTAALQYERAQQMADDHRKARITDLSVRGKVHTSYKTDDLMRTNYQGNYEQ